MIGGKLVGEHSGGAVDAVDRAFMSGSGTVLRDHKSGTLGEMRALEAAAEKAQMYRSEEQKLTDHHQATGYANAGPVSFGQYEVGRSSLPTQANPTRIFLDQTKLGVVYPHMEGHNKIESGDPGQYDPYQMAGENAVEIQEIAGFTHNKMGRFAFGSLEERDIGKVRGHIPGNDSPGPCMYHPEKGKDYTYRTIMPCYAAFNSKSLQRGNSNTPVPGPGSYDANMASVEPNIRDSGASMKSAVRRLEASELSGHYSQVGGHVSTTSKDIGPGRYEFENMSLADNLNHLLKAQSRSKPGFGTFEPPAQAAV